MVGDGERGVRDEVGGREAERAPALVAVGDDPAQSRTARRGSRAASATAPAATARGCASRRRSRRRPRPARRRASSNASCSRSSAASPWARLPKRKFSPTDTRVAPSRSISSWSMNSCARLRRERCRRTGSRSAPRRPRPAIRSAFCSSVVSSFGRGLRRHDRARVRLEGERRCRRRAITSRWPACTPSNSPTARRRGAARRVRKPDGLHQPRKPTTGLRVAPPRGSARAIRPSASRSRTMPLACPGTATPWAALRGCVALELDHRQERQRVVEADQALLVGVGDVEVADARCAAARRSRRR